MDTLPNSGMLMNQFHCSVIYLDGLFSDRNVTSDMNEDNSDDG